MDVATSVNIEQHLLAERWHLRFPSIDENPEANCLWCLDRKPQIADIETMLRWGQAGFPGDSRMPERTWVIGARDDRAEILEEITDELHLEGTPFLTRRVLGCLEEAVMNGVAYHPQKHQGAVSLGIYQQTDAIWAKVVDNHGSLNLAKVWQFLDRRRGESAYSIDASQRGGGLGFYKMAINSLGVDCVVRPGHFTETRFLFPLSKEAWRGGLRFIRLRRTNHGANL